MQPFIDFPTIISTFDKVEIIPILGSLTQEYYCPNNDRFSHVNCYKKKKKIKNKNIKN